MSAEMQEAEDTQLKDQLREAFAKADNGGAAEQPEAAGRTSGANAAAEHPQRPDAAPRERNAKGQFAAKNDGRPDGASATEEVKPQAATKTLLQEGAAEPATQEPAVAPVADKPPKGWPPAMREKWTGLDAEVRKFILQREGEASRRHAGLEGSQRTVNELNTMMDPYRAMMAAEGSTWQDGFRTYLQTAALLRLGGPQQKAGFVASLLQQFGIDPGMVADAYVGAGPARAAGGQAPGGNGHAALEAHPEFAALRQKVVSLEGAYQQAMDAQQAHYDAQAERELTEVADLEFFEDLREDMATLMDAATASKRQLTYKQAYDAAVAMSPEIQTLLQQRSAEAQQRQATASTAATAAAARQASVSVRGRPAPPPAPIDAGEDITGFLRSQFGLTDGR